MLLRDVAISELIGLAVIDAEDLATSQDALLAWLDTQKAFRQRRVVEYLVREELAGRGHLIKSYSLALDVFGKDDDFDPVKSSLVRVEMHRLRQSLARFLKEGGHAAPYLFVLPSGQYRLMAIIRPCPKPEPDLTGPDLTGPDLSGLGGVPGGAGPRTSADQGDAAARGPDPAPDPAVIAVPLSVPPAGQRTGWRRPLAIASALTVVVAALVAAFWLLRSAPAKPGEIAQLSPSVEVRVVDSDAAKADLVQVKAALGTLTPGRFPVIWNANGDADYVLELSTFTGTRGVQRLRASLLNRHLELVGTETYVADGIGDEAERFRLAQIVERRFLKVRGFLPVTFAAGTEFSAARLRIYGCYQAADAVGSGSTGNRPDFDDLLKCLDPDKLANLKDKALIHIARARIIAGAASGDIAVSGHHTLDEARAELASAESADPDASRIVGEQIVLEWRDPDRSRQRLLELVVRAQRLPMDAQLRYEVAISYAYYLGDAQRAEKVVTGLSGRFLAGGQSPDPLFRLVAFPDRFVRGDFAGARQSLVATGAVQTPIYAILSLALACADGSEDAIQAGTQLVELNTTHGLNGLTGDIRRRKYDPGFEKALLGALSGSRCRHLTEPA